MKPLNDVERINKGDFLYPSKHLLPYVVLGFTPNGVSVRDMKTGGIINHINIFTSSELDTYQIKYIHIDEIIKFVKRGNPARLEKGSIIIDHEGVLRKGKNREWMVLMPAENQSYSRNMEKRMSASNYVLVPINKKSGKPMLESKGVGARELHRLMKRTDELGQPFFSLKMVGGIDNDGNLYLIGPTEHEAFRESLTMNWEK